MKLNTYDTAQSTAVQRTQHPSGLYLSTHINQYELEQGYLMLRPATDVSLTIFSVKVIKNRIEKILFIKLKIWEDRTIPLPFTKILETEVWKTAWCTIDSKIH